MHVTCIIDLKNIEPFREALKIYLGDSKENQLYKCE